ncbi:alpha/beta hydrolase [Qipengyuania nanhaisediminis]|uniref:alpha/beta hydrolase n=1 Tax=Qipengyuania nanhaisediminis TaxID=604088 RepID=UPI0038B3AE82
MKKLAALLALIQLVLIGGPALAQPYQAAGGGMRTVATESWVEEWDAERGQWVRVAEGSLPAAEVSPSVNYANLRGQAPRDTHRAARYARPVVQHPAATTLAQYGPFIVTSATSASMIGSTDSASPAQFDAMVRDFPGLAVIEMVEAPGTSNDIANLAVARRIRANGIATHVPDGGSVRSGAVELFLAGAERSMADSATFAVHSWLDNHGREADDFPADHEAHRLYIDFYVEMGMSEEQARAFYAMTNSVPHASALWLEAADMRPWLARDRGPALRLAANDQTGLAKADASHALAVLGAPALAVPTLEWGPIATDPAFPAIAYDDLAGFAIAQGVPSALTQG